MTRPYAPAASTVRFALLIATVLATSAFIYLSLYSFAPPNARRVTETVTACSTAQEADPAFSAPVATREDIRRATELARRFQACLRPVLRDQAAFVAGGFGLLFGLTALLYLAHPWWIVRRRTLKSLSAHGPSPLLEDLEQLSREMGLARSPDWRLAPFARTTGGQAFGLPWHRYVQIDAGLAVLRVTDRPGFRAVVLHELAHLRNRDVGKTYLTVSIWRAFALVALLPYLISILHPGLLHAPLRWDWQNIAFIASPVAGGVRIGSLLVLIMLVYLTRNAILRVRETHADATAAAHDNTNGALQAVLSRLPAAPWWRRWGTHPDPRRRIDTVGDPRLLLATGFWEVTGAGFATGLVCSNIGLLLGIYFIVDPNLAFSVAGLVISSPAIALLAVAIWRTTARDPAGSPPVRVWLGYPAAMVAGFAAGTFPTLRGAYRISGGGSVSAASWTISTLLLLTGAVFLAAWLASVTRNVLAQLDRPLWTMFAVVAVAVFVGAVWFGVWWPPSLLEAGFADGWGPLPAVGADIDWYARLAAVTAAPFGPMGKLVFSPLTLLGLTLMWLVPVLAHARRRGAATPISLRPAVIASIVGALGVAIVGVALPFAAEAVLSAEVRQTSDADGLRFAVVYQNTTIAMVSLAVAAVMAAILARRGPHRPALALLAGSLTTVLSLLVLVYAVDPVACYVNLFEVSPAPAGCLHGMPAAIVAERAHWAVLQAFLVAAPAMLVAAAAGWAIRRARSTPPNRETKVPTRFTKFVTGAVLALLVAVNIWFSVLAFSGAYRVWLERTFG